MHNQYCKLHHFSDGTNLMNFQTSIEGTNEQTNIDLKTYQTDLMLPKFFLMSVKQKLLRLVLLSNYEAMIQK